MGNVFFQFYSWSNPECEFPQITLRSIDERSVTLELKYLGSEKIILHEIVLDKANCEVEIWREGSLSVTAMICAEEPCKRKSGADMEVPAGCLVT